MIPLPAPNPCTTVPTARVILHLQRLANLGALPSGLLHMRDARSRTKYSCTQAFGVWPLIISRLSLRQSPPFHTHGVFRSDMHLARSACPCPIDQNGVGAPHPCLYTSSADRDPSTSHCGPRKQTSQSAGLTTLIVIDGCHPTTSHVVQETSNCTQAGYRSAPLLVLHQYCLSLGPDPTVRILHIAKPDTLLRSTVHAALCRP